MRRILAGALALAATAGLTLPFAGHAPASAAIKPAAVGYAPAADTELGMFHPHLVLAAPVMTSWLVRSGDNLSLIAKTRYGVDSAWPLIYWANHKHVKWANQIQVGQILNLPVPDGPIPPAPKLLEPPPPPPPPVRHVTVTLSSSSSRTYHSTYTAPASSYQATSGTYHGSGSMQQCIISRESGGNAGVWNASGHWGLYQFSSSTWAAHGGSPGSFGSASVAEQNRVYYNTVAEDGYSDWAPYDGC